MTLKISNSTFLIINHYYSNVSFLLFGLVLTQLYHCKVYISNEAKTTKIR